MTTPNTPQKDVELATLCDSVDTYTAALRVTVNRARAINTHRYRSTRWCAVSLLRVVLRALKFAVVTLERWQKAGA